MKKIFEVRRDFGICTTRPLHLVVLLKVFRSITCPVAIMFMNFAFPANFR